MSNTLPIDELRAKVRKNPITCWNCKEHVATDVHHINGNHSDNRPENLAPWCKRCHNEHHGISDNLTELGILVEAYQDIQKLRISMSNRVQAYQCLGYDVENSEFTFTLLRGLENRLSENVKAKIKDEPIYRDWLQHVNGIGHILSAKLIHEIGSVDKFATVSSVWAYGGMDVRDGAARRRRRGEKANWNPALRMLIAELIPSQFVRSTKSFGRKLYEQYKAFYTERDGEELSKGHIERRARRKLGKVFIACLYAKWRELDGLPVSEPYAAKLQGHSHFIRPEDWIE